MQTNQPQTVEPTTIVPGACTGTIDLIDPNESEDHNVQIEDEGSPTNLSASTAVDEDKISILKPSTAVAIHDHVQTHEHVESDVVPICVDSSSVDKAANDENQREESSTADETFSSSCSILEIREVLDVGLSPDGASFADEEPLPDADIEEISSNVGNQPTEHGELVVDAIPKDWEQVPVIEEKAKDCPHIEKENPNDENEAKIDSDPEASSVIRDEKSSISVLSSETVNITIGTEQSQLEKGNKENSTLSIDSPFETPGKDVFVVTATEVKAEATVSPIQPTYLPKGLAAVAIQQPVTHQATHQVTFEPFDSLTFTELKKVSCMAKVKNVHGVIKRVCKLVNTVLPISRYITWFMYLILFILIVWKRSGGTVGGLFEKLVITAFIILAVKVIDFALNIWYGVCLEPLKILIEARDIMGETRNYIITDKRSHFARSWDLGAGGEMEIVFSKNPKVALWKTSAKVLCSMTTKIELERSIDGAMFASYQLFRCCGDAQEDKANWWRFLLCRELITSVQTPLCGGQVNLRQPIIGERNDSNLIEPREGLWPHELAIRKNAFSCEDLMLGTSELLDVGVDDIVGEDVAGVYDTVNEAIAIKDDAKDAYEQLKEDGYQKVQTSDSVWDVKFRPGMSEDQKAAVVLYVIKQYTVQDS